MKQIKKTFYLLAIACIIINVIPLFDANALGTQEISFTLPNSDREIITEIYYPIDEKINSKTIEHGIWHRKFYVKNAPLSNKSLTYPLVIFSHGWQGDRFGNSWIAESLVKEGYIVAMIEHTHNTSYEHSDLFLYTSMWQRPLDVSEFLTYLLNDKTWGKVINQEKIVAGGFSLGGLTSLWLSGIKADKDLFKNAMDHKYSRWNDWPEYAKEKANKVDWSYAQNLYYDKRIKAIFSIAPDLGEGFDKNGLKQSKIPSLIIVGTKDFITPAKVNAEFYAKNMNNSKVIIINDAEHFDFMNNCSKLGKKITPHLCNSNLNRNKLQKQVSKQIVDFLSENLGK